MAEIAKALLIARKIFDVIEKGGWKRVSGAMCVGIIAIFVGIGGADVAHVWLGGISAPMSALHTDYLWELFKMFLGVYAAKWVFPHAIRLIALLLFKGDKEAVAMLFNVEIEEGKAAKVSEVKTLGED